MNVSLDEKRAMIEMTAEISIRDQCMLLVTQAHQALDLERQNRRSLVPGR